MKKIKGITKRVNVFSGSNIRYFIRCKMPCRQEIVKKVDHTHKLLLVFKLINNNEKKNN